MGVLLRGVKREQLKRGQIIAVPGSIKAVKQFHAQLYVLTKDEGLSYEPSMSLYSHVTGGRYTPFMSNYRPQLFLRTADITTSLTFPPDTPDAEDKMVRCIAKSKYYIDSYIRLCRVTTWR